MDTLAFATLVLVVGCAGDTPRPHIWTLTKAGEHVETAQPGITAAEKAELAAQAAGSRTYELIGVADFVDAETSRKIGARGAILAPGRVNATGALARGRKVAVKGLYIDGQPARINLTSVADLGSCDGV
jgi:hypothetical protein